VLSGNLVHVVWIVMANVVVRSNCNRNKCATSSYKIRHTSNHNIFASFDASVSWARTRAHYIENSSVMCISVRSAWCITVGCHHKSTTTNLRRHKLKCFFLFLFKQKIFYKFFWYLKFIAEFFSVQNKRKKWNAKKKI